MFWALSWCKFNAAVLPITIRRQSGLLEGFSRTVTFRPRFTAGVAKRMRRLLPANSDKELKLYHNLEFP